MKRFKVGFERKDYGHGAKCYSVIVEAENAEEAENIVWKKVGVEEIYSVKELSE